MSALAKIVLVVTVSLGPPPEGVAQERIACGLSRPNSIALVGDYLYFGETAAADGFLSRAAKVPAGGCTLPERVASGAALPEFGALVGMVQISFSPTHLYFGYGSFTNGHIDEIRSDGTLRRTVVELSGSNGGGRLIALLSEQLYYFRQFSNLYRISTIPGSSQEEPALARGVFPRSTVSDGSSMYFFDLNSRNVFRLDTSNPRQLVFFMPGVPDQEGALLMNSADVFLAYPNGLVRKKSKEATLHVDMNLGAGAWVRAIDDSHFYFTQGDELRRMPLSVGESELLAKPVSVQNSSPFNMLVDASHLYWIDVSAGNDAGVIYRLSKGAAWAWPIDAPLITQDYACENCIKRSDTSVAARPNAFHTGIDMRANETAFDRWGFDTPVRAAAEGEVVGLYRVRNSGENGDPTTTWCDGSSDFFDDLRISTRNSGLGNVVIVKHADQNYSLYGHLDCINRAVAERFIAALDSPGTKATINAGERIGTMGNSSSVDGGRRQARRWCSPVGLPAGKTCDAALAEGLCTRCDSSGFGPHLHFEAKATNELSDPATHSHWGYTPLPPDRHKYSDPMILVHRTELRDLPPTTLVVQALDESGQPTVVRVRPGPRLYDSAVNALAHETKVIAFRKAVNTDGEWYQVHLAVSDEKKDNLRGAIEGWVRADFVRIDSTGRRVRVKTNIAGEPVRVYEKANGRQIGYVWSGQEFAVAEGLATSKIPQCLSDWRQIFVGNISRAGSVDRAWICMDNFELGPID